jgi:hypothetical protein
MEICMFFTKLGSTGLTRTLYSYPARDGRMDDELNATRIEWYRGEVQKGNPWASVNDVKASAITCAKLDSFRVSTN